MNNENSLQRFVDAQRNIYFTALSEMQDGKKQSHWIWFIFPQIRGLGKSSMSEKYSINDIKEAEAFLEHPLLGPRLVALARVLLGLQTRDATALMGSPDDLKLKSCMTLFSQVPNPNPVFEKVLGKFFNNQKDIQTLNIIYNNQLNA